MKDDKQYNKVHRVSVQVIPGADDFDYIERVVNDLKYRLIDQIVKNSTFTLYETLDKNTGNVTFEYRVIGNFKDYK